MTTVKDFNENNIKYNGYFHQFFWDKGVNPNATIENGLANCTTFVYGVCKAIGLGAPVSRIVDARNWHKYLNSGWIAIPYDRAAVRENDIIEWDANHVGIAESRDRIASSWYTGMHGKAYFDGKYDTRSFSSLKEMSEWMVANYHYRFFHKVSIEQEIKSIGAEPTWILRKETGGEIPEKLDEIISLIEEIKEVL